MAILDLDGVIQHGHREIAEAEEELKWHRPMPGVLCLCGRVWQCEAYTRGTAWIVYWHKRLTVLERQRAELAQALR